MRRILMVASAAAMAISMPAVAKDKGGGHGGGKPEKHQGGGGGGGKAHKAESGGGGGQQRAEGRGRGNGARAERAFARQERRGDERRSRPARAERQWAKAEKREDKARRSFAKAEQRSWKNEARRVERRDDRREFRRVRGDDRRDLRRAGGDDRRIDSYDYRYRQRYADNYGAACPPGLARKNNGCLPPGQAKKIFAASQVLPLAYYGDYNIPYEYQSWYQDSPDSYYRYDDGGYIYQVDRGSGLIESLIPLLGGGFGVGQLLPAGYDTYNLPMQYRDDYADSDEAYYRYGDDAIYQVDPQTNMIESIVALLGGDLNVGGLLPSGYDTYNLPMEYRDDYVDDADSMYRYADNNIYEIDPKTQIIEQIVASLV